MKHSSVVPENPINKCPICLDYISKPYIVLHNTNINHSFCQDCIINWINTCKDKPTCPLCRSEFTKISSITTSNLPLFKILTFLMKKGISFKRFPNKYKNDFSFVETALSINGLWLKHVSDIFKNNLHLALIAVAQNGRSLEFVSPSLLLNKFLVKVAVTQCGIAIRFAPHFKKDKEIALIATKNHRWAFIYIDHIFFNTYPDSDILDALNYAIQHDDGTIY